MLLSQEFYMLWSALELFMALTHLFVFLGFKNSTLDFLRRKHNYFLVDGMCHLVHLFIYRISDVGLPLYGLWVYAFIAHMYYYRNLKLNPPPVKTAEDKIVEDDTHKISRIFHWSCIEYKANRFSLTESGKEMFETSCDVIAHGIGFYLALSMLTSIWYQIGVFAITAIVFHRSMTGLEDFLTDPKMMPAQIQRLIKAYSMAS